MKFFLSYLQINGFASQGFDVPGALKDKTDFLLTVRDIVNWILGFTGTVAFLIIVWAAFSIVTAAGNADKVKKARSSILYAIIGIIIIAVSYSAVTFLTYNLSPAVLDATPPTAVPVRTATSVAVPTASSIPPQYQTIRPTR